MGSQCNRFVCFDNFVGRLSGRLLASCLFVPKTTNRQAIFWRVSAAFAGLSGMLQHIVLHIGCIFYHQLLCLTAAKKYWRAWARFDFKQTLYRELQGLRGWKRWLHVLVTARLGPPMHMFLCTWRPYFWPNFATGAVWSVPSKPRTFFRFFFKFFWKNVRQKNSKKKLRQGIVFIGH